MYKLYENLIDNSYVVVAPHLIADFESSGIPVKELYEGSLEGCVQLLDLLSSDEPVVIEEA